MNSKLYELMQEAGYAAPNLAPRAGKLVYLVLEHLLDYAKPNSYIADEIADLLSDRADPSYYPVEKIIP